jgi:hypothetical protein
MNDNSDVQKEEIEPSELLKNNVILEINMSEKDSLQLHHISQDSNKAGEEKIVNTQIADYSQKNIETSDITGTDTTQDQIMLTPGKTDKHSILNGQDPQEIRKKIEENFQKSFYSDCLDSGYFVLDDSYATKILESKLEKRKRNLTYGLQALLGVFSIFFILSRKRYLFPYLLFLAFFNTIANIVVVINNIEIIELIASNPQFLSFGSLTIINEGIFIFATNIIFIIYLHTFHLFTLGSERVIITGKNDNEENEKLERLSLNSTIRRLQLNQNFFYFDFCFPNSKLKKFSNNLIQKLLIYKRTTILSKSIVQRMNNAYSGYELAFIILRSHPVYLYQLLKSTWSKAIVLSFLTLILIIFVDQTYTLPIYENVITFASLIVPMSAVALIWDSADLNEKINSLSILTQLISLDKAFYFLSSKNYIPPIDITCQFSLQTWNYCRKIVFDYKKGLSQTVDLITLLIAIPSFLYIIQVFQAIVISDSFNNQTIEGIKKYSSSRLVLVAVFLLIIIRRLYHQMKINAFFSLYAHKLLKLKQIFIDILSFQNYYLNLQENTIKDKTVMLVLNICRAKCKNSNFKESLNTILSNQQQVIDNLIEEIQFERNHFSFKFLGFFTATPMAFRYVLLFAGPFIGTYFWNQLRLVLSSSS